MEEGEEFAFPINHGSTMGSGFNGVALADVGGRSSIAERKAKIWCCGPRERGTPNDAASRNTRSLFFQFIMHTSSVVAGHPSPSLAENVGSLELPFFLTAPPYYESPPMRETSAMPGRPTFQKRNAFFRGDFG
jgi:hypothetical protein